MRERYFNKIIREAEHFIANENVWDGWDIGNSPGSSSHSSIFFEEETKTDIQEERKNKLVEIFDTLNF